MFSTRPGRWSDSPKRLVGRWPARPPDHSQRKTPAWDVPDPTKRPGRQYQRLPYQKPTVDGRCASLISTPRQEVRLLAAEAEVFERPSDAILRAARQGGNVQINRGIPGNERSRHLQILT